MLGELMLGIVCGYLAGIITGLTPGLHLNTVSIAALSISPLLFQITTPVVVAVFIVGMAVTHATVDALPSIFLGAPDADHALSVLPGHRLLQQGQGYQAVALTVIGSLYAAIILSIGAPVIYLLMKHGYPLIKPFILHILIIVSVTLIYKETRSRAWALISFLLSGVLGIAVLNINIEQPLFPLFSGLFGISILLQSIFQKSSIPRQTKRFPDIKRKELHKALLAGTVSSLLVGTLPGLGSAQAAIISTSTYREIIPKYFLIITGSINTVVMIISFIGLAALDKTRSGAVVVISQILELFTINHLILFMGITLVVAGLAAVTTLKLTGYFADAIQKVNYSKVCWTIIIFITILVMTITGPIGLLILLVSTATGLMPGLKGVAKNHLMGSLLLPIILYLL